MARYGFVVAFLLAAAPLAAQHQHQAGMIENTTAPMSDKVVRQRLQIMGYSNIQISKSNTLRYQVHAVKSGQPVVLEFHPQSGQVRDVTPGRAPTKPWIMPVEPPGRTPPIRNELPPR